MSPSEFQLGSIKLDFFQEPVTLSTPSSLHPLLTVVGDFLSLAKDRLLPCLFFIPELLSFLLSPVVDSPVAYLILYLVSEERHCLTERIFNGQLPHPPCCALIGSKPQDIIQQEAEFTLLFILHLLPLKPYQPQPGEQVSRHFLPATYLALCLLQFLRLYLLQYSGKELESNWSAESVEAEAIKLRPKRLEGLLAAKIELKSIKGH